MNYELFKNEFINLKKEELAYIDGVAKISSNKILSEYEKIEIYRNLKKYGSMLKEMLKKLFYEVTDDKIITKMDLEDVVIEFDLSKNFLSSIKFYDDLHKKYFLESLKIDSVTFKFELTLYDLIYGSREYSGIDSDIILNNQKLIENSIYIFDCYYDDSENCYGPCVGDPDDYLYGVYEHVYIKYDDKKRISKRDMNEFEKDKMIIHSTRYVRSLEIRKMFEEELLNIQNKTLNDCFVKTKNRVEKLNYTRSPEYKEKILLDRISDLYKKVKGELIQKEMLYSGVFLGILKETYKLPNQDTVLKEKIIKNGGKDSVIVIAINQDNEYIITFQNRINDKIIAEFPSGYIEIDEDPIDAAKRELKEETGYISDDLFVVDEAYTSPGIDNSVTYIVIANNCIKTDEKRDNSTELLNYGLFSEIELKYLVDNNIMNGAINKLAYYNLVNNVDNSCVAYINNKKKYKKQKKTKKKLI